MPDVENECYLLTCGKQTELFFAELLRRHAVNFFEEFVQMRNGRESCVVADG